MKNLVNEWYRLKSAHSFGATYYDPRIELQRYIRANLYGPTKPLDARDTAFKDYAIILRRVERLKLDIPTELHNTATGSPRLQSVFRDVRRLAPTNIAALLAFRYEDVARANIHHFDELRSRSGLRSTEVGNFLKGLGLIYSGYDDKFYLLNTLVEYEGRLVPREALIKMPQGMCLKSEMRKIPFSTLNSRGRRRFQARKTSEGVVYLHPSELHGMQQQLEYVQTSDRYVPVSRAPSRWVIQGLGHHGSSGSRVGFVLPRGHGARMGFEWEMVVDGSRRPTSVGKAVATLLNEVADANYALAETDSSVPSGFELVTSSTRLSSHAKVLMALEARVGGRGYRTNPLARCSQHDKAGVHVHIARKDVRNPTAMAYFLNIALPDPDIFSFGSVSALKYDSIAGLFYSRVIGRQPNHYCSPTTTTVRSATFTSHEKFVPLNTCHQNTLELRIFGSTQSPLKMLSYLEFTQALADWTALFVGVPKHRITLENFARFIEANKETYVNLAGHVAKWREECLRLSEES